jgi:hypothetical protein
MTEQVKVLAPVMELSMLTKLIGRIGKRGVQIHNWIQEAAINAVAHSIVNRNITPAQQLVDALTGGNRKDSLVRYLEKFGNLAWSTLDDNTKGFKFFEVTVKGEPLAWTPEYAKLAREFDWSKAIKAPTPKSMYDVADALSSLIEAAHRAVKKGLTIKHGALLSVLEQAQADLHREQYSAEQKVRDALRENANEKVEPAPSTVTEGTTAPAPATV